ncbi:outer membrane beta-barrel protein [Winogradskyella sp. R77965]|uniref:porin family protein n=1 Tax=Winogradskyella sp. R77965 TaxID=3093872 RepID=UPI0037DCF330
MKKIVLSVVITFLAFVNLNAQDDSTSNSNQQFGIRAGYSSFIAKVKVDGVSGSDNISGFYIGVFTEIELSDKFNLQPELVFSNFSQDGESSSIFLVPVLAKLKVNNELSLYAGPQFDYLLNKEDSEGLKRFGLGLALGASYEISQEVFIDIRYSLGISDRLDGDLVDFEDFEDFNIKAKLNYLQIGLGYRF